MSDVGLYRSDIAGLVAATGERCAKCSELCCIPKLGAGPMRLDIADHVRLDAGCGLCGTDHLNLHRTVGCDHSGGLAVVING